MTKLGQKFEENQVIFFIYKLFFLIKKKFPLINFSTQNKTHDNRIQQNMTIIYMKVKQSLSSTIIY